MRAGSRPGHVFGAGPLALRILDPTDLGSEETCGHPEIEVAPTMNRAVIVRRSSTAGTLMTAPAPAPADLHHHAIGRERHARHDAAVDGDDAENAVVLSIDEKTSVQAKERKTLRRRCVPTAWLPTTRASSSTTPRHTRAGLIRSSASSRSSPARCCDEARSPHARTSPRRCSALSSTTADC